MNKLIPNNVPVESLLNWFKQKPRSSGWDAILAYDREDTNTVLLQEYILRHNTTNQMDPITFELEDNQTPTYKAFIFEYRFDTPRLSFEESNISSSRAKLTSKVIDGVHVTFEMPTGALEWDVIKIGAKSPLVQTNLEMDIDLTVSKGEVDSAGRVVLDISKGTNYKLNYSDTEHLRRIEGARFQQAFSEFPVRITEWVLNELKIDESNYLQPKEFHIRTHQPHSAQMEGAANSEAGEVLVFITMKGGTNGSMPATDADLHYLIPDGHSATLVLGHQFLMNKIIAEGVNGIIDDGSGFQIVLEGPDEGFVQKLTVKNGERSKEGTGGVKLPHFNNFDLLSLVLGLGKKVIDLFPGDSQFFLEFKENKLILIWSGTKQQNVSITTNMSTYGNNLGTQWQMRRELTFALDSSGSLKMKISETGNEQFIRVMPEHYRDIPDVAAFFEEIAGNVAPRLEAELNDSMTAFLKKSEEIDIFRLNSLLFRGDNAVKLERAEFPGDLVTFGKVGPTQTTFTLDHDLPSSVEDRLEPMIGHGQTLRFKTVPATSAKWSVENIDGNTGDTGVINPDTGVYTAPTADKIDGRFLRVRVSAKQGEHTASALVSVLLFDIDISLQIQIVGAGNTSGRELAAGTLGGEALKWEVSEETAERGGRVEPSLVPKGDHTYRVGPPITGKHFTVDEVIVSTESGRRQSSYILVHHLKATLVLAIKKDSGLPDNQLQMVMIDTDTGEPVEPGGPLVWAVPLGAGSINVDTGVVTINPSHALPFIVVTLTVKYPGIPTMTGFKLLPIPMFSVPETRRLLRKNN